MKIFYLVISVLAMFLCTSCEEDIEFKYQEKSMKTSDFEICHVQQCPEIEIVYTQLLNPETLQPAVYEWTLKNIATSLNIKKNSTSDLDEMMATYINNSQISYPETNIFSHAHEFSAQVEVLYSSNTVVCLGYYSDIFDGGAHGYYEEVYGLFDPKSAEPLEPESLVEDSFFAFAKAKLSQSHPTVSFTDLPLALKESVLQMGFTEEGLLLSYKDRNSMPIVDDPYRIVIPWSEAKDHLTF